MPVNIGSSNPYPVPFAPQIRPQASSTPQPARPATMSGPPETPGMSAISGFGGDGMTIPSTQNYGDGMDFGFNFGGFDSPSSYNSYAPEVHPAQSISGLGSLGLGGTGQSIFDRLSSIGDTPYIDSKNIAQGGINAAGAFFPGASVLAGILNGFNILPQGETTGNAGADILGTPGAMQSTVANATNWINRQFGGNYMPSSYIDPNMGGPPTPDGSPFYGEGQYSPAQIQGPNPDGSAYSKPSQDNMFPGWGGAGSIDYTPQPDPFFQYGGNVLNIGGADLFNSIGLSPLMTPDFGGTMSYANAGMGSEFGRSIGDTVGGNGFWAS